MAGCNRCGRCCADQPCKYQDGWKWATGEPALCYPACLRFDPETKRATCLLRDEIIREESELAVSDRSFPVSSYCGYLPLHVRVLEALGMPNAEGVRFDPAIRKGKVLLLRSRRLRLMRGFLLACVDKDSGERIYCRWGLKDLTISFPSAFKPPLGAEQAVTVEDELRYGLGLIEVELTMAEPESWPTVEEKEKLWGVNVEELLGWK